MRWRAILTGVVVFSIWTSAGCLMVTKRPTSVATSLGDLAGTYANTRAAGTWDPGEHLTDLLQMKKPRVLAEKRGKGFERTGSVLNGMTVSVSVEGHTLRWDCFDGGTCLETKTTQAVMQDGGAVSLPSLSVYDSETSHDGLYGYHQTSFDVFVNGDRDLVIRRKWQGLSSTLLIVPLPIVEQDNFVFKRIKAAVSGKGVGPEEALRGSGRRERG